MTSLFDLGLDFWWYDENWHDIIPGLAFDGPCGHDPTGPTCLDHLIWGQEIFRSATTNYNRINGPRNKTKPFSTLSLSMCVNKKNKKKPQSVCGEWDIRPGVTARP